MARKAKKVLQDHRQYTLGLLSTGSDEQLDRESRDRAYEGWAKQVARQRAWLGYLAMVSHEEVSA